MFKLVGDDVFHIDQIRCILRVDPAPGFKYEYSLSVDGKSYKQYREEQARAFRTWIATVDDVEYRVVLGKSELSLVQH